jgi:hypothetical protein
MVSWAMSVLLALGAPLSVLLGLLCCTATEATCTGCWSELRWAVNVNYMLDFEDLMQRRMKYLIKI